jgi:hypothetical protein
MKRLYAIAACLIASSCVFGQDLVPYQAPESKDKAEKTNGYNFTGDEPQSKAPLGQTIHPKPNAGQTSTKSTFWEYIIGNTQYDLQSNGSVDDRFVGDGTIMSATWTQSLQVTPFNDRGTGYNYNDGVVWDNIPTERIESVRIGWPSIVHTAGDREAVFSHVADGPFHMAYRDIDGGSWSETEVPTNTGHGMLWPRAVAGGADGNTIHLIGVTTPVANDGTEYMGIDGALLYWRSTDQGDTWDMMDYLDPLVDSTQYLAFDGDNYAIHANGNKVAFAYFNDWGDTFVMISEDNGSTWSKTILVDFPVDLFPQDEEILDLDEDLLADTVTNADGGGSVLIDAAMQTHVLYGNMRYLDDAIGDAQWSYFPFTDGLEYWNENFGPDSSMTIAVTMDMDGDDEINLADDIGTYFMSLTGLPSMGEDENGDIYVSYSGVVETHATGTQNFRHIFLLKSEDGGSTWTTPVDVTPDVEFIGYEAVFVSMLPIVGDRIHMIYQRDTEPGLHVRGDLDPVDMNDIMHYQITKDLEVDEGVSVNETVNPLDGMIVYPNPTSGTTYLYVPVQGTINIDVYDVTGKLVLSQQELSELITLDVSGLQSGLYTLNVSVDGAKKATQLIVD